MIFQSRPSRVLPITKVTTSIVAIDDAEDSEIELFLMGILAYATELAIKQGDAK